jgi:hypothetical protein
MAKWADYLISGVRFDPTRAHIDSFRVHCDNDATVGSSSEKSRSEVLQAIKSNATFITIFRSNNNEWNKGQEVYIVTINGSEYLKTVDNSKAADNLDNLPEF